MGWVQASGTSAERKPNLGAPAEMAALTARRRATEAGRKPHICTPPKPGRPHSKHGNCRGEEIPRSFAFCLKLTTPRENFGGSIQRYFCGPFRLFSRILSSMRSTAIVVADWGRTSISGVRARFHLLSTFLFRELDQVALGGGLAATRRSFDRHSAACLSGAVAALCSARRIGFDY